MKVTFNGRFLSAPQTGVQRVAANLIKSVDHLLVTDPVSAPWSFDLAVPPGTSTAIDLKRVRRFERGRLRGQAWEQFELPLISQGALVNLCNAGPLLARSALTMIHDAQVYLSPASYPKAFVEWYKFSMPKLANMSRYIVTVSDFSKSQLVNYGVANAEKIIVVPNGADHMLVGASDLSVFDRLPLLRNQYVFAFGNLQEHKNLQFLFKLFQDVRLKGHTLAIVGPVDWDALGAKFGVKPQSNVVVTGRLTDGEIRALLESAICLAMPSLTEGFGLPPLEAMLVGCPALVSPKGALPEVCGDAALYASLDDPKAWIDAILDLYEDHAARAERRSFGKLHAQAFTWDRSARMLLKALDKAMA